MPGNFYSSPFQKNETYLGDESEPLVVAVVVVLFPCVGGASVLETVISATAPGPDSLGSPGDLTRGSMGDLTAATAVDVGSGLNRS